MSMLPPVFVELRANIKEFSAKMGEARAELMETEAASKTTFTKMATIGKGALLGVGVIAAGVGYESVKLAMEFENSHKRMQTAIKNSGVEFEKIAPKIEEMNSHMRDLGFTDVESQDAMTNLTTALGSPTKALKDMSLAADLARFKHIPLAQAATAVAKAHEGFLRPLKSIGIDLPVAAGGAQALQKAHQGLEKAQKAYNDLVAKAHDHNSKTKVSTDQLARAHDKMRDAQAKVNATAHAGTQIMDALQKKVGGQAQTASETLAGKFGRLKANTDQVFTAIGLKLIPILSKMLDVISKAITWLNKHRDVMMAFGILIGGFLIAVIGAYIISMLSAAAATIAATWPILVIIAAIAGLIMAGLWLKNHWHEIWEKVKETVHKVVDWVKDKFHSFVTALKGIFSGLGNIIRGAFSAVGNIIKGYFNIWIGIIDWIVDKLNMVIDKANKVKIHIPGFGTVGVNIPHIPTIPKLANGGIVSSPTIAMIGEAGPEAVVPLSRGHLGAHVTVHVHGSVIREHDLAVSVRDQIAQLMRRRGLDPAILGV